MARERYLRPDYVNPERMHSYGHQLAAIIEAGPRRVVEIGLGSGFVEESLAHFGIDVTTVDIDASLEPDIAASVTELPIGDDAFCVASCCQLLEHLPFDQFGPALAELRRVASRRVVLSLPDVSRSVDVLVRAPKIGRRRVSIQVPSAPPPFPDERRAMRHEWEIGFAGTTLGRVRSCIEEQGLRIERSWRVPENPWHRFFVLTP